MPHNKDSKYSEQFNGVQFEENRSKNTQDREQKRNGDKGKDRQTDRHSTQIFGRRVYHNTPHILSGGV